MRTLRLSLTGVVALVLFGFASGTSVAQDDADAQYTAITGSMSIVREIAGPRITTSPNIPQESGTGWVFESALVTSDPRLTGTAVGDHNYLAFTPGTTGGRVWSGTGRLTNDGGSWLIEFQGFAQPGKNFLSNNHYMTRYTGEDGYAGLSAMTLALPTGMGEWDIKGVLFPGPMPEFPDYPELPAE